MPRRDVFHSACRTALEKAGWTVTHDPYRLRWGLTTLFIDLAAESLLAAEKAGRKIAVEVKSLLGKGDMPELERALGQYVVYRSRLKRLDPERHLYLAVVGVAYEEHFDLAEGRDLVADEQLRMVVFDPEQQEVTRWID